MPVRRRLLLSTQAAVLLAALTSPAAAQSCDDPDPGLDLGVRAAACEEALASVYDRSYVPQLVYNLGRTYRLQGLPEQALPYLTEALRYNPENEFYWAELGQTYLALGEPGTGAAMYSEARRLAPGNPYLAGEQAEMWLELGQPARCLATLEEALPGLAGDADEAWFIQIQGRCLALAGRHADAVAAFTRATELYVGYVDAMGNRAVSQHAMGLYEEVLADSAAMYDPAVVPDLPRTWDLVVRGIRIEALVHLGRTDEVQAEVDALAARYPGSDLGALNGRAWALFLLGRAEEADAVARPIRDAGLGGEVTAYMLDTLAQIDLALGRTEDAKMNFMNAAWYDPSLADGWLRALTAQGYLPQTATADAILASLIACIDDKAAGCSVAPLPVDPTAGKVPLPARPDPGPGAIPPPADPPASASGEGEPDFEPVPADAEGTAPAAPVPPGLGATPRPVAPRPAAP